MKDKKVIIIVAIFICIILLLGLIVFSKANEINVDEVDESRKISQENSYDGPIKMSIKDDTLTSKGATFILKNDTDENYWYDPVYYIEKKEDNKWNEIALDEPLSWNTVLYTIKAGEEIELNIDWSITGYGVLKTGEYRIIKKDFRKEASPDSRAYSVYVEFEIK